MARKNDNGPSDAQILSRLRRRSTPATARDLGVTANRLRALEGVVEVGRVHTGKAGRPAILFTTEEKAAESHDRGLSEDREDSDAQAARDGSLSAVEA